MSKKIWIGLGDREKLSRITEYLNQNPSIDKVVYFTENKRKPLEIDFSDVEYRTWADAIMYKYFYPLLEKIDHNTLLIFDEMMRTRKRTELTYNCCHHYGNQTGHILVFEWFPMIEQPEDFMILLDFAFPYVYKGQPYSPEYLRLPEVTVKNQMEEIVSEKVEITEEIEEQYEEEKERLFKNIGNKDPDTIPRTLHIWCGTHCKKDAVKNRKCLARNSRLKTTKKWTDLEPAEYIVDFPIRQLQFNDYCKNVETKTFHFLNSGLSADEYYFKTYKEWLERLGEMYVESSIYEE